MASGRYILQVMSTLHQWSHDSRALPVSGPSFTTPFSVWLDNQLTTRPTVTPHSTLQYRDNQELHQNCTGRTTTPSSASRFAACSVVAQRGQYAQNQDRSLDNTPIPPARTDVKSPVAKMWYLSSQSVHPTADCPGRRRVRHVEADHGVENLR